MIPFAFLSCCVLFSIFFFLLLLFILSTLRSHAACSYNENATSAFSHAELIELFTPEGSSRERRIKEKCMRSHLCDIVRLDDDGGSALKHLESHTKKKFKFALDSFYSTTSSLSKSLLELVRSSKPAIS